MVTVVIPAYKTKIPVDHHLVTGVLSKILTVPPLGSSHRWVRPYSLKFPNAQRTNWSEQAAPAEVRSGTSDRPNRALRLYTHTHARKASRREGERW